MADNGPADNGPAEGGQARSGRASAVLRSLKPTALSLLFLAVLLFLQAALCGTCRGTAAMDGGRERWESEHGIGRPVSVAVEDGETDVDVRWAPLLLNLAACHALSVLLARAAAGMTGLRRPAAAYLCASAAVVLLAFLGATTMSRIRWGYWFARPGLPGEIDDVARVNRIVAVTTEEGPEGRSFAADPGFSLPRALASARGDPYYCLEERILLRLEERGLLPESASAEAGGLSDLRRLIAETGVLAESEEGYDSGGSLRGVVVDAEDASGVRLLFVCARGGQVSNDHYPFYELVFRSDGPGGAPACVHGRRFFYDVAGCEGVEWYVLWPFLAAPGLALGLPVFTAAAGVRRLARRRRRRWRYGDS